MRLDLRFLLLTLILVIFFSGSVIAQEGIIETGEVEGLAMSQAGDQLLTWTPSTLTLWDTTTGTQTLEIASTDALLGAQLSADGTRILSWSAREITLWSAEDGRQILSTPSEADIGEAAWVKGANLILFWTASGVYQVDVASGSVSPRYEAAGEAVIGMSANDDAAHIAVLLASNSVVMAGEEISTLESDEAIEVTTGAERAADLIPGKWQVTWGEFRTSCEFDLSTAESRPFILLVEPDEDVIRVEDIFVWSLHNFRYERQMDGTYFFRRNETDVQGFVRSCEYSLTLQSPSRIEGMSELFVSGLNCSQTRAMVWTLIDENIICMAGSDVGTNMRSGPGTNFRNVGVLRAATPTDVIGQAIGTDNLRWWKLADNTWVRDDVVAEDGDCENVPTVPAEETT